jgi:hypothetical protein
MAMPTLPPGFKMMSGASNWYVCPDDTCVHLPPETANIHDAVRAALAGGALSIVLPAGVWDFHGNRVT